MTGQGLTTTILLADPPSPTMSCPAGDAWCAQFYRWTGSEWLATSGYYVIVKPLRILLILALAGLARYVAHRMIQRIVRSTTTDSAPSLLRPLHKRVPAALRAAAGRLSERRRERAEALGSVLSSTASIVVVVITAMTVLGELGVDLAPILASAGIAGLAIGFGAQNLVKDFIAGLFMLLEDQYGIGDVVDLGNGVCGTVEAVGLRVTTVRDDTGIIWYVRNGGIDRVGNKSQGSGGESSGGESSGGNESSGGSQGSRGARRSSAEESFGIEDGFSMDSA